MAYRADIEIAVKGARALTEVSERIGRLSKQIDVVNKAAKLQNVIPASINNYKTAVQQATEAVKASVSGTTTQKRAIDLYVKSLVQAEKAERNLALAVKQRQRELGVKVTGLGATAGGGGGRTSGVISNALIGGSFPLLFGQGGTAAAGGALGGAIGGIFGGTGGFAGSLLGTLIGQIAGQANQVKELANDIGLSAQQTALLSAAFKQAGADFDKFQASVQNIRGLGLSLEDQADTIQLVSKLTEVYGGKVDKVTDAFTGALERGKVTQGTLNQLTSQGIPIQDALAQKYKVSRDAIFKMAKDGTISVQTLADVLVDMGNKGFEAGKKPKSAFDQFTTALGNTATAIGNVATTLLNTLSPALDTILIKATEVLNAINAAIAAGSISQGDKQKFKKQAETTVSKQAGFLPGGPFGAGAITVKAGGKTYSGAASDVVSSLTNDLINAEVLKRTTKVPTKPLGKITVPGQAAGAAGSATDKAADEARRLANAQGQVQLKQRLVTLQAQLNTAILAGNKATEFSLKFEMELEKSAAKIAEIKRSGESAATKTAQIQEAEVERLQNLRDLTFERQQEETKQQAERKKNIDDVLNSLDMQIVQATAITDAQKNAVKFLEIENQLRENNVTLGQNEINTINGKLAALTKVTKEQEYANNRAAELTSLYEGVANQIAGGVGSAIDAVANSTENLGTVLTGIGQQILATVGQMMIFYGLAQAFGALSGGDTFGVFGQLAKAFGFKGAANGGYWPGGFQAFADGGMVTRPTMGLVGEGGEAEYIIPASKMRGAMNRYAAGARGSAVIPAGDGGDGGTATMVAAPGAIDVRYTVERINSVDYVTADQFQQGMQQAAQQGAAQGEQRTLRRLQMSTSTRKRLGM